MSSLTTCIILTSADSTLYYIFMNTIVYLICCILPQDEIYHYLVMIVYLNTDLHLF